MDLNSIILFFFLIWFKLIFYKFFLSIFYNFSSKILIDDQFDKPQAFHESPISISAGLGIFFSLLIDQNQNLKISPVIWLFIILTIGISHGSLDNIKGEKLLKIYKIKNNFFF